ncbi:MAG: 3-hydroxyacyl-CoA dehydrogenase NAD-binding domain-containing protein [Myxococcales bacterium]|nr:3-hydroxyacyl-CoA dehydrogenase NAD-binding domain-containing protein [Myxococcales bacterium]
MAEVVKSSSRGQVALIQVDNPPVNALSQAVRQGLSDCLERALADAAIEAIVIACEGRTFIAGADIREFGKPHQPPALPAVIDTIEASPKPVVAAIHGTALGGGLEVALGCHFRVGVASAKCGLPEVKLGLLPGAGGTQRLPRLIGAEKALDMIVSGEPIDAAQAHELGLLDAVIDGELVDGAVAFAQQVVGEGRGLRRLSQLPVPACDPNLFEGYRQQIATKKRGFEAPARCIDTVQAAVELPFAEGVVKERELFEGLRAGDQSRAQRHVFFAEREVAKIPDVPKDTPTREVASVGIVGAGTMGGGIAMACANAGLQVTLLDREMSLVEGRLKAIAESYQSSAKRGRMGQAEAEARIARIAGADDYAALASVDLVIEAVFEEMEIKKTVFKQLDAVCKPGAILATNTSTLDVNEIAAATGRPQDVIGLHFFSPANIMRLLEIVRGDHTDKSVIATAMKLSRTLDKIGVLVGVCHGFVGNRILYPYRREALFLVEEGASPQQVDRVITDFGLPMGPFAMSDLAGLDIGWRVRKAQGKPEGERYSGTIADRLCEAGHFGQKTGQGFYRYEAGSRVPKPYPELQSLVEEVSRELGIERREISDEEILKRCIYPMINEGYKILDEGIALRASDIDIVWINGYGFPAYRGGPMFYGELEGLDRVHATICEYRDQHGALWEPSPLLAKAAAEAAESR